MAKDYIIYLLERNILQEVVTNYKNQDWYNKVKGVNQSNIAANCWSSQEAQNDHNDKIL